LQNRTNEGYPISDLVFNLSNYIGYSTTLVSKQG